MNFFDGVFASFAECPGLRVVAALAVVRTPLHEKHKAQTRAVGDRVILEAGNVNHGGYRV